METTTGKNKQNSVGRTKQGKVPHHMDKPGWKNKQANRLYNDQCKIQEHSQKGTKQHLLARKCKPKSTTQSANDATLLQCSKKNTKSQYRWKRVRDSNMM